MESLDTGGGSAASPGLEVRGLSKTFPAGKVLEGVTIEIAAGEVLALIGENGSGKSTLIKILSGYHAPDPGAVVRVGGADLAFGSPALSHQAGLRFVHQDLGLIDNLSVADNLSLPMAFPRRFGTVRSRELYQRTRDELAGVGLTTDPRARVASLSPARRSAVAVARALREEPTAPARVLVLDEPTATLPLAEVRLLLDTVRAVAARGVAVLYVTHRLDEVFEVASRVTVLRNGAVSATMPTAGLDHAALVAALVGREFETVHDASGRIRRAASAPVLEVAGLRGTELDGVSFSVAEGEIVGIAGITGSGRESVLLSVFGGTRAAGARRVGGVELGTGGPGASLARGVAYLPPDRKTQGGVMAMTALENMMLSDHRTHWRFPRVRRKAELTEFGRWSQELDLRPGNAARRPFALFSGGNQQKILLARCLRGQPKVLLLDEPTQGVDIGAKEIIHHRVVEAASRGAAVAVTSSDVDELVALCHRVLVLRAGRVVGELTGDAISAATIGSLSVGLGGAAV
jgi:ribose transport system ATP-binding protein